MDCSWNIRIQLGDSWGGDFSTWLADILGVEEELRREIGNSNGRWVVEGEGLDTGESNVLG